MMIDLKWLCFVEAVQILAEPGPLELLLKHWKGQLEVLPELILLIDLHEEELLVKGTNGRKYSG